MEIFSLNYLQYYLNSLKILKCYANKVEEASIFTLLSVANSYEVSYYYLIFSILILKVSRTGYISSLVKVGSLIKSSIIDYKSLFLGEDSSY